MNVVVVDRRQFDAERLESNRRQRYFGHHRSKRLRPRLPRPLDKDLQVGESTATMCSRTSEYGLVETKGQSSAILCIRGLSDEIEVRASTTVVDYYSLKHVARFRWGVFGCALGARALRSLLVAPNVVHPIQYLLDAFCLLPTP